MFISQILSADHKITDCTLCMKTAFPHLKKWYALKHTHNIAFTIALNMFFNFHQNLSLCRWIYYRLKLQVIRNINLNYFNLQGKSTCHSFHNYFLFLFSHFINYIIVEPFSTLINCSHQRYFHKINIALIKYIYFL